MRPAFAFSTVGAARTCAGQRLARGSATGRCRVGSRPEVCGGTKTGPVVSALFKVGWVHMTSPVNGHPANRRALFAVLAMLMAALILTGVWGSASLQSAQPYRKPPATAVAGQTAGLATASPESGAASSSASAVAPSAPQATEAAPAADATPEPAAPVLTVESPPAVAAPAEAPAPATDPAADDAARVVASNQYVVAAGDTVGSIAARFGLDPASVLAANGLGPSTTIMPGQVLKLSGPPVSAAAAAPAPAPAEAPAQVAAAPAAVPPPAPAARTIYVAGSGGQAMVDRCIGPIHFTPTDAYSLFITEHDFCGGWARFSGIGVGETVVIAGYGTYTATGRGQVPQGGSTNDVAAVFGGFPRAVLQTCVPGTHQMLLIALN